MKTVRVNFFKVILLVVAFVVVACEVDELKTESVVTKGTEVNGERAEQTLDYQKEEGFSCLTVEQEPLNPSDFENSIHLGEKIKIPQSIEIMKSAWDVVARNGLFSEGNNPIKVNRLYVRFLPTENHQVMELARYDENLDLFDFPLHYEFEPTKARNDCYRDRELPLNTPSPLYTVVDADYAFPSFMPYEIIENLYMPDEDASIEKELANLLEEVAENIALDIDPLQGVFSKNDRGWGDKITSKEKWRPEGRIRMIDYSEGEPTDGQAVPVKGVQVLARSGLKWSWGITDEYGEFRVKKEFKNKVNYSLRWSNHEWYIIKGSSVTRAWHFGPKREGIWDEVIDGTIQSFYGILHRAAYDSFYAENYGVTRPMRNKPGNDRIWIRAFNRASKGKRKGAAGYFYDGVPHTIGIYAKDSEDWRIGEDYDRDHNNLFKTVVHEFGHASHRNLFYIDKNLKWNKIELIVAESWAEGVGVEMLKNPYPKLHRSFVNRKTCWDSNYTYVVKDLLYPNGIESGLNPSNPSYQLNFPLYHLKEIEDGMGHTWEEWQDNLTQGLNKFPASLVRGTFDYWETACD
ncbi:hypothetical protein [Flagellimonas marina]|uniref:Carboxypeptidase regulatory-like domain-containing protein n=1 Tax=Flagellimonas marina TaxID=1775168 RepID=A0ABV8PRG9_9FLAO